MVNWSNCTCPFCGSKLSFEIVGIGRDKCRQYRHCTCPTAQAAGEHNRIKEALDYETYLKRCAEREAEEAKRGDEEAKKPVIITAAEYLKKYWQKKSQEK